MKVYKVIQIPKNKLVITGKGNSNLWDTSETLIDFCSPWDQTVQAKISFKALWDEEYLFFCFKVKDESIYIDTTDDSFKSINESDRVELFFRENESLNPYYCLEIDPRCRIMDFKAQPNKKFDFNWKWLKSDLEVKSNITENGFTVEGKISINSLKALNLINGNKIETGIFRANYRKLDGVSYIPTWITWVDPKTKSPNFHTPSSFGILELE